MLVVAWYFGWLYVAVIFVMVVAYVWFTFSPRRSGSPFATQRKTK